MDNISKVLWLTGFSGSGKSTIATALKMSLSRRGIGAIVLDGDNIRNHLCKDLGFSQEDRIENIRRVAEVCKLFSSINVTVIASFISPTNECRNLAKRIIGSGFKEIYVSCPLQVCEDRDVKGLYKRARAGEIKEFTGISSIFDAPVNPDVTVETDIDNVKSCVDRIMGECYK